MFGHLQKRILRAVGGAEVPSLSSAEYEAFFSSRVWLALRQSVASRLDQAVDAMFSANDLDTVAKAQGLVQGLVFILEHEDALRELIQNETELCVDREHEQRVRELLKLFEENTHAEIPT